MITEWDMSALPTLTQSANVGDTIAAKANINPYADGLPADVAAQWNDRMEDVMRLLLKHSDVISRVNAWGVADGDSWKNDWPIPRPCRLSSSLRPQLSGKTVPRRFTRARSRECRGDTCRIS